MTVIADVNDLVRDHVSRELECIHLLYPSGCVPRLEANSSLVRFLKDDLGRLVASPAFLGQTAQRVAENDRLPFYLSRCAEAVGLKVTPKEAKKDEVVTMCSKSKPDGRWLVTNVVLVGAAVWLSGVQGEHGIAVAVPFEQLWADAQKAGRSEKSAAVWQRMQWWREARFGLFIHWNPSSLVASEISWCKDFTDGQGEVSVFLFDAGKYPARTWETEKLFKLIYELQPNIVINDRCGLPADYSTPEQVIGSFNNRRNWESNVTFTGRFSWKGFDVTVIPFEECLRRLVYCAGGDGNLLMNIDPLPTGDIHPEEVNRLKRMGEWLGKYGESIYGTSGGPYKPGDWGACTCRVSLGKTVSAKHSVARLRSVAIGSRTEGG